MPEDRNNNLNPASEDAANQQQQSELNPAAELAAAKMRTSEEILRRQQLELETERLRSDMQTFLHGEAVKNAWPARTGQLGKPRFPSTIASNSRPQARAASQSRTRRMDPKLVSTANP